MEQIARQDTAAFRRLFDRHAPLLLALGCRVLNDRQLAEDVLNEVFLELWQSPQKYDAGRSSPRTYLVLVMRRRSIDRLRSRRSGIKTVPLHASSTDNHPGRSNHEDAFADAEERQRVRSVLAGLPEAQRRAIELSFFEGKTNVEIAESTGEPLGTIKGRIRLGLIRLRDQLRTMGTKGGRP
jgi:RNA polymerase sigma-70 factor (ECF subfamily)